ncbi:MAG: cell division protein FtsA [Alphaproteobacteria bacterium]|nr:cell division protein FtsA [Alphaproteobacteria bacterium]NCT07122.1 cell division protein FtsA [Alphaproteobacteria bacterium]
MAFKLIKHRFSKSNETIVTGLDIGSSKVCCAIARIESSGDLTVLGYGYQGSKGLRGGMIIDMEALQDAVAHAVHGAEEMAGETIEEVYVSISPALCQSKSVRVDLSISAHPVDDDDIKKIIQQAVASVQKTQAVVIHNIPLNYDIDGVGGIRDPRGMFGELLKAKLHLMLCPRTPLRNLSACVERSHLDVSGFVSSVYASGMATLVDDELDLGVTLIDMGAGSSSIGLFFNGKLAHVDYVPLGGSHVTSDIARCFSTPLIQAERLKTLHGSALLSPLDGRESVVVPQIGDEASAKGLQVTKAELTEVIRPRVEEILDQLKAKIEQNPAHKYVGKRLVLTGGASLLSGVPEIAGLILDKQTRLARPLHISGLGENARRSDFVTCAGLLTYGQRQRGPYAMRAARREASASGTSRFGKVGGWFKENF